MSLARTLRLVAVLIAIAGAADPSWTRVLAEPQPVRISIIDRPTLDLPDASETRRAQAVASAARLRDRLDGDYTVEVRVVSDARLSACPESGVCVLVSDERVENPIPAGAIVVGGIGIGASLTPNVSILQVEPPLTTGVNAAAVVRVHLRGVDVSGESTIEVSEGGVVLGTASHTWSNQGGSQDAAIDVPWVPLAEGLRRLRVSITALDGERTDLDNVTDVVANVRTEGLPILFHEAEASWLGTFVRRALEDDGRFVLAGGTRLAPSILVTRGREPALTDAALRAVRVAVVAAPHTLSNADVAALERFSRERGGTVVLLLDRRPEGPLTRLLPPIAAERQLTTAQAVGPLQITEAVTFSIGGAGVKTLASLDTQPVIVSRAVGRGHVIVSGALDAWRARDDGRFAAYWSSLVGDAALAAGPDVEVTLEPALAQPGDRVRVTVRHRTLDAAAASVNARAELRCGDERTPIRLWPEARPGVMSATLTADGQGMCEVEASMESDEALIASAPLFVASDVMPLRVDGPGLETTLAAYGGTLVRPGDEATLATAIRSAVHVERVPRDTRPMRSPWWILPFAACLSGEWWLRRRSGAR